MNVLHFRFVTNIVVVAYFGGPL